MEEKFGSHVHIFDWTLHFDEGTPHIHERHAFDCENKYGELCPQQEKSLEELGIPLSDSDKKKGKKNNRILIGEPKKVDEVRTQEIWIVYNFVEEL